MKKSAKESAKELAQLIDHISSTPCLGSESELNEWYKQFDEMLTTHFEIEPAKKAKKAIPEQNIFKDLFGCGVKKAKKKTK